MPWNAFLRKRISQAMAVFQRESETVLHIDEDSNSAESSDESKPKRQQSAGKTKKYDGSAKYRVKYNPPVLIVNLHLRIDCLMKLGDVFAKSAVVLLNLKVFLSPPPVFSLLGVGRSACVTSVTTKKFEKISTKLHLLLNRSF